MGIETYMKQIPELMKLLEELPSEALARIQVRDYQINDYLIKFGGYENNIYVILQGVCDIARPNDTGVMISNYKISNMDVIGLSELYQSIPVKRYASVIAKTPVTAAVIPSDILMVCFGKYQNFTVQLNLLVINRLHQSIGLFAECNNYPLFGSVITYLIYAYHFYKRQYAPDYYGLVKINESRQEMADTIGVDVRSINRVIEKLKTDNFVKIIRGKIYIDKTQFVNLSNAAPDRCRF